MPVGRKATTFNRLNTAVLTPIARPSPRTVTVTTPGLRRSRRPA